MLRACRQPISPGEDVAGLGSNSRVAVGTAGDLRVVADSMVQEQSLEHLDGNLFVIVGPQTREQGSIGRALHFWVVVTTRPSSMA